MNGLKNLLITKLGKRDKTTCIIHSIFPLRPECVTGSLFLQRALEGSRSASRDRGREPRTDKGGQRFTRMEVKGRQRECFTFKVKHSQPLVLCRASFSFFVVSSRERTKGAAAAFISKYKLCSALTYARSCQEVKCTAWQ